MEKEFSKFKIYGTLFALGCAGGSIYIIPYIKYVFYDLQLEVSGMNNTQSAFLLTAMAMGSMVLNTPLGMIVDKLDLKKAIMLALIVTTIFTVTYAYTFQSYIISIVTWILYASILRATTPITFSLDSSSEHLSLVQSQHLLLLQLTKRDLQQRRTLNT